MYRQLYRPTRNKGTQPAEGKMGEGGHMSHTLKKIYLDSYQLWYKKKYYDLMTYWFPQQGNLLSQDKNENMKENLLPIYVF